MLMLDLCCGLKGANAAMMDRGWEVLTLDIDPQFEPDIVADVRTWHYTGPRPDLIWASPPCQEFSRDFMPWLDNGGPPDLSLVNACRRIVQEVQPHYWAIENVRGAIKYLGKPREIHGPYHLWGFFPCLAFNLDYRNKESMSSTQSIERAKIPYSLSLALCQAVEVSMNMFDWGVA